MERGLERSYNFSVKSYVVPSSVRTKHLQAKKVCTTPASSAQLEQDTRQQAKSGRWKEERRLRVTSLNFGVVATRAQWTSKGLKAFTDTKDLGHIALIKYGTSNEPLAARRYQEVLQTIGHHATVNTCGLLVNPAYPWLGASPDGIVWHATELGYRILEIKCPYTVRDKTAHGLVAGSFCPEQGESVTRPNGNHDYYAQIIGQMGVSGLSWGDFVVFSKDFMLIERIRRDPSE
ncbi:hypothetical protein HPB48_015372 [Haemaphysalis longicornis]|uniref:YqaJ viral recombinase domain-containing protein n=1 Tax=Haemaphysalis longicornis TaxID=44386 RepID=A0A9J6GL82_HAELO|nr:hypothetical protein HPB48_015372 [Haemaphysalis longicornis]